MEGTLRCTLESQTQHILWKTIHGLSNRAPPPPPTLNTSITFNNKITPKHIANCFTKQLTNTVKHATHKTNKDTTSHSPTSQAQEAVKQSQNNYSQGPDKLNRLSWTCIPHEYVRTALNKNIIPHTWKLANIDRIPKTNKHTDKGTLYRPISLLSVIAKTLEKSLLPYTPMQHGYKTQHFTVTALHTLNNTVAKGFNQMAPPARTITVALDMTKAFDTINIHTLIRKLIQTNIPGTIIRFIANYIKGRETYTTYRNHTSRQRQFKTGVPQGGVLSPTLFNTSDLSPPSAPVQVMVYADDITITSTHTSTSAAKKYIQPYLLDKTKQSHIKSRQRQLALCSYAGTCSIYDLR